MRNYLLTVITVCLVSFVFTGCKKDQITLDAKNIPIRENLYPDEYNATSPLTYIGNNLWGGAFGGSSLILYGPAPTQILPGEKPIFRITSATAPCVSFYECNLTMLILSSAEYIDITVKQLDSDGTLKDTIIRCYTYGTTTKYYGIGFNVAMYNSQCYLVYPTTTPITTVPID